MPGNIRTPVIVVGVSGSAASARALRWAADEAARRHAELRIVFIWEPEQRAFYAPGLSEGERARHQRESERTLESTLRRVLGPGSLDDVTVEIVEGMAERLLVERSAGADLLVLGEASGQLSGRSAGPAIRTALSRAHCPVVVVGPEGPYAEPGDQTPEPVSAGRSGMR